MVTSNCRKSGQFDGCTLEIRIVRSTENTSTGGRSVLTEGWEGRIAENVLLWRVSLKPLHRTIIGTKTTAFPDGTKEHNDMLQCTHEAMIK